MGMTARKIFGVAALLLAAGGAGAALPPKSAAATASEEALVGLFRERLDEVRSLSRRAGTGLGLSTGLLVDLGKVDFILSHIEPFPSRFLHSSDHDFVFEAAQGQPIRDLEANLPAAVNYVRLATASRYYHWYARRRPPLFGLRRGSETVRQIAKQIQDFRDRELRRLETGAVSPETILTKQNLGELGDPRLLERLAEAYETGEDQFQAQRNSVAFLALGGQLALGYGVAIVFLRRPRTVATLRG